MCRERRRRNNKNELENKNKQTKQNKNKQTSIDERRQTSNYLEEGQYKERRSHSHRLTYVLNSPDQYTSPYPATKTVFAYRRTRINKSVP